MASFVSAVASLPTSARVSLDAFGAAAFADVAGCTLAEWMAMAPAEVDAQTAWEHFWHLSSHSFARTLAGAEATPQK